METFKNYRGLQRKEIKKLARMVSTYSMKLLKNFSHRKKRKIQRDKTLTQEKAKEKMTEK